MIKALLKKQMLEMVSGFMMGKDGKRRSTSRILGVAILMLYAFFGFGVMVWGLTSLLCAPLVEAGLGWVYFAVLGLLASCMGLIGSVFAVKSKLYEAKDNSLLLAMPIPSWALLFVRMLSLYMLTFLFENIIFVPALIRYFFVVGFDISALVCGVLAAFIMPLGTLAVCCLLGFVLAWLIQRLPYKNFFTIVGFALFMVAYFVLYNKMNEYVSYVIMHGEAVGRTMNTLLFPFAQLGKAASGNWLSLCWFVLLFGGVFAVVYFVLSKTYIQIATTQRGERYAKYKEKRSRIVSPIAAFLKKEFFRFIKTPMYLLNASMGTILGLIFGVMTIIKGGFFGLDLSMFPALSEKMPLLLCAIVLFLSVSNTISACSISLEGDSLWLARSLPMESKQILFSKAVFHFVITAPVAVFVGVVGCIVLGMVWYYALLIVALALLASAVFALVGIVANLLFPNMNWSNETAVVKQSISVMVAMLGGFGVALLAIGGFFLFGKYLPAWGYIAIWLALLTAVLVAAWVWIDKKGKKIFESL